MLCKTKIFGVRHFEFNLFNLVKVARWKKLNIVLILTIQQIGIFPLQNWESGGFSGFCKGDNRVPHCKTRAQLTPIDSKTKDTS